MDKIFLILLASIALIQGQNSPGKNENPVRNGREERSNDSGGASHFKFPSGVGSPSTEGVESHGATVGHQAESDFVPSTGNIGAALQGDILAKLGGGNAYGLEGNQLLGGHNIGGLVLGGHHMLGGAQASLKSYQGFGGFDMSGHQLGSSQHLGGFDMSGHQLGSSQHLGGFDMSGHQLGSSQHFGFPLGLAKMPFSLLHQPLMQQDSGETSEKKGHHHQPPILVPVPVKIPQPYVIKVPVLMTVEKKVEVPITKHVPYPVEKPYHIEVIKKVPYVVPKPYPIHVSHLKHS